MKRNPIALCATVAMIAAAAPAAAQDLPEAAELGLSQLREIRQT